MEDKLEKYEYRGYEGRENILEPSTAILAFGQICEGWGLDDEDAATLLGLENSNGYKLIKSRIDLYRDYRLDISERVKTVFNITLNLYRKFGEDKNGKNWLRIKMGDLGGKSPLEYMLNGSMRDLFIVESLSESI